MTPAGRPVRPEELAEAVGAPTTPFTPEKRVLSMLFRWSDDDRLCAVGGDPT